MTRIKKGYWIMIIILFVSLIISLVLFKDSTYTNIILSFIAAVIATIAVSLTDLRKRTFKGQVSIWTAPLRNDDCIDYKNKKVIIKIENNDEEPVDNFIYRMKYPSKYFSFYKETNSNAQIYYAGNSEIIIDSSWGFLGKKDKNSFITINLKSDLDNWKSGFIFLTITGANLYPYDVEIKYDKDTIEKILKADSSYPYYLIT